MMGMPFVVSAVGSPLEDFSHRKLAGFVKSPSSRHSREGGSPELLEKTGFLFPDYYPRGQASRE